MSSSSNPVVDKLYDISEKSAEIMCKFVAGILNTGASVTTIGVEAIKKGNNKFVETVSPAYNNTKEKIGNTVSEIVPLKYKGYFKSANSVLISLLLIIGELVK